MKNIASIILAIITISFTASAANADTTGLNHKVSNVTEYGDGIKVSDFQDKSGFIAEGGGGSFTYDSASQTMTCVTAEGVIKLCFNAGK